MTANIRTERDRCRQECKHGRKYPGIGDVRRCEHGHIWHCHGTHDWGCWGDWERLIPVFWSLRYRRARRALAADSSSSAHPIEETT